MNINKVIMSSARAVAFTVGLMIIGGSMLYAAGTLYVDVVSGSNTLSCGLQSAPCQTIQYAINKAVANDDINVAAGTYHEQITVNKPLIINGADGAVLEGTPTLLTPALGATAWTTGVKIKSANVTFNNIDVTNFRQDGIIIGYEASIPGSLQNVHITNCKISNIQPGYWGFGIYAGYESEAFKYVPPKLTAFLDYSGLLIEGNEIVNAGSSSLVLQSITGTPGTLVVRNNYIHDGENDGIWIDCARNIVIENNNIENNIDGIYISSYGDAFLYKWVYDWTNQQLNGSYGPKDVTIKNNRIVGHVTYGGVYFQAGYPSTILINRNNITGNVPGLANYLTQDVNATCNWWGDISGPGPVGTGIGDQVSENVTYSPWLIAPAPNGLCLSVAANKDQCKKDGWMSLIRANGTRFKNQGDCVSYVNTGK